MKLSASPFLLSNSKFTPDCSLLHWLSYCWKRLGKDGREAESCCLCCRMRGKCLNISIKQSTWMALVVPSSAASLLHPGWLQGGNVYYHEEKDFLVVKFPKIGGFCCCRPWDRTASCHIVTLVFKAQAENPLDSLGNTFVQSYPCI